MIKNFPYLLKVVLALVFIVMTIRYIHYSLVPVTLELRANSIHKILNFIWLFILLAFICKIFAL